MFQVASVPAMHPFPVAGGGTIWEAIDVFFQSGFNDHLDNNKSKSYPDSILKMWRKLNQEKAETYPLDDLVHANMTLANLMEKG